MSSTAITDLTVAVRPHSTHRRTLADLPAELKALIVEMASRQDERLRERVNDLYASRPNVMGGGTLSDATSLLALSEVNREWNALAAVELFQVFGWKALSTATALRPHPDLVHILHVRKGIKNDTTTLFHYVPQFHHITTLSIDPQSLAYLFGSDSATSSPPTQIQRDRREVLRSTSWSLDYLDLGHCHGVDLGWVLPALPTRHLDLGEILLPSFTKHRERREVELAVAQKALAGCTRLDRLSIMNPGQELLDAAWPPLRRIALYLETLPYTIPAQHFLHPFAATLDTLEIDDDRERFGVEDEWVAASLPNLRRLLLGASAPIAIELLQHFSACPVTDVTVGVYLERRSDGKPFPHHSKILDILIKQYSPQLRKAQLGARHSDRGVPNEALNGNFLVQLAAEHKISLTLDPPFDVFVHGQVQPVYQLLLRADEETRIRCDSIDEVLRFTSALLGRMRAMGDEVGIEGLERAAGPLRDRMTPATGRDLGALEVVLSLSRKLSGRLRRILDLEGARRLVDVMMLLKARMMLEQD